MGVYTHTDGNWFSRRGTFIVALIAFHILLFWALKSGFAVKFMESIAPPIVADIINEVKEDEPPPPPPEVKMEIPPVVVPPPIIDIQLPVAPSTNALSNVTDTPPPPRPPAPPAPPPRQTVLTSLKVDPQRNTATAADFYPSASLNNEEEGLVKVSVCVGGNGRAKTAELSETSGISRLDEAGVKYARAIRYIPKTEDGKPVDACGIVPIRFTLPKR